MISHQPAFPAWKGKLRLEEYWSKRDKEELHLVSIAHYKVLFPMRNKPELKRKGVLLPGGLEEPAAGFPGNLEAGPGHFERAVAA